MPNLILVCGLPGSGKSTFLSTQVKNQNNCKVISRDEIRFSLLQEGEPYFSHEEDVYKIFWLQINESLSNGYNTYVDQTSLTPESRQYLLKHITEKYELCNIVWFNIPTKVCIERNENRKGTKAYVPKGVIRRMAIQMIPPSYKENFDNIFTYDENNQLKLRKAEEYEWELLKL